MAAEDKKKVSFFRMLGTAFIIYLVVSIISGLLITGQTIGMGFGNVALIEIRGVLTTQGAPQTLFSSPVISSDEYARLIDEAANRRSVDAIVISIDSPGGTAVASYEIVQAIKRASEKKPVITYIREVGASGAYWAASASDHIIIQELAVTGSVGVIASYLEFSGLFEKYGIQYVRVTGGEYKDLGSPFRNATEEESRLLQAKIDEIHNIFYDDVEASRGLHERTEEELRMIRSGIIFTAREALSHGLVDEIGSFERVEEVLKEEYGLERVQYSRMIRAGGSMGLFGMRIEDALAYIGFGMGRAMHDRISPDSHITITT
ncbi:MAG: signal peptide peptidase SppA [Candidatus Woesearchaeota archaeon]